MTGRKYRGTCPHVRENEADLTCAMCGRLIDPPPDPARELYDIVSRRLTREEYDALPIHTREPDAPTAREASQVSPQGEAPPPTTSGSPDGGGALGSHGRNPK